VGRDIKVLRDIGKSFGDIQRSARQTSRTLNVFRNAFAAAFAGVGIREVVRLSDQVQLLFDRITAFEGADNAERAFQSLAGAANFTRTSLANLAESYTRVSLATQELGLSQDAIIGVTTALQQSFRIAGASIAEAQAATIQLTQGLASGQLRGQELRSVLEANSVIGGILAKEFNTTRGELIKFAEAGTITSDRVIKALSDNFENLNERAEKLGQTIQQTVTVQLNKFQVSLLELNRSFEISNKIAKLAENIDLFAAAIVGAGAAFTASKLIPILATALPAAIEATLVGLAALRFNFIATIKAVATGAAALNPTLLVIGALAAGATFAALNWEKARAILGFAAGFILKVFRDAAEGIVRALAIITSVVPGLQSLSDSFTGVADNIAAGTKDVEEALAAAAGEFGELSDKANKFNADKFGKALEGTNVKTKATTQSANELQKFLAKLNKQYLDGAITAEKYQVSLSKFELRQVAQQFKEGEVALRQYQEAQDKVKLTEFNQQISTGDIKIGEYNQRLREIEFDRVKRGFDQGTVSVLEFQKAGLEAQDTFNPSGALFVGVSQYIQQAGTLSSNVADAIGNTFGRLEDSLVEFIKTGTFQFRQFTQAILDDLTRIIVRQTIVRQLAAGIGGGLGLPGFGGGGSAAGSAKGDAFVNGSKVTAFQDGGIVSNPTFFGFNGGSLGVAGEAGSEAILPLQRTSDGDLGVKSTPSNVTVNVFNNTNGTEVTQRESEDQFGNRTLDVIIQSKVTEGFSSGVFDGTLRDNFGINRRGR
jgi:lambda family phage tail tape measure protein